MAGFARVMGAVVVVIALIAAQMTLGWAGCHFQRHAAGNVDIVKVGESIIHGVSYAMAVKTDAALASADQPQSSPDHVCLGHCGCTCGMSGAFVLSAVTAIRAPNGVALMRGFASAEPPLGNRPDGPRRPPRTTA